MTARDAGLQVGDLVRMVTVSATGLRYMETILWEVLSLDNPQGPCVRVARPCRLTPHEHFIPWCQEVAVEPLLAGLQL